MLPFLRKYVFLDFKNNHETPGTDITAQRAAMSPSAWQTTTLARLSAPALAMRAAVLRPADPRGR